MKKNRSFRFSVIFFVVISIWMIVLAIRMGKNMAVVADSEKNCEKTASTYTEYVESEQLMRTGSDVLTNSARSYVYTGDTVYADAYFSEVYADRNREKSIENLIPDHDEFDISDLLAAAMEQSVDLMDLELHAMRLRAEADGCDSAAIHADLAAYELTEAERSLSAEEKRAAAMELVLGNDYVDLKNKIWGSTQSFIENALEKTNTEHEECSLNLRNCIKEQRVLFACLAAGIALIGAFLVSVISEKRNGEKKLKKELDLQTENLKYAFRHQTELQDSIIDGMAKLVESRDMNTGEHVKNTRSYVSMIVHRLLDRATYSELNEEYADDIIRASVLHDVGKIYISDFLLNKPGKLSQDEFEIIKNHTILGGDIVDEIFESNLDDRTVEVIRDLVVHHHEKWDGTGYPDKLKGSDIPLGARIMAVADVFDALISKRPYKQPMSIEKALSILEHDKGTHFDPEIVDAFVSLRPLLEEYLRDSDFNTEIGTLQASFKKFEEKVQQESVISGLANDYEVIFYVRPDENRVSVLRSSPSFAQKLGVSEQGVRTEMDFDTFNSMAESYIYPEDLQEAMGVVSRDSIRDNFDTGIVKIYLSRLMRDAQPIYYQAKLIRLGKTDDTRFDVLIGLTDVDMEIKKARQEAEELAAAKKLAEEANAAKTEFVYETSRSIRTIVSNVIGYTDMLDKYFDDAEKSKKYLSKVKESEDELMEVLGTTLDMETIEKGKAL